MAEGEEPFTLPLPPPDRDVVFFRRGGPPSRDDREHEDIMLRRAPRETAAHCRGAAGARGLTHAQLRAALGELHVAMRPRADRGDAELVAELERLGLTSVTV